MHEIDSVPMNGNDADTSDARKQQSPSMPMPVSNQQDGEGGTMMPRRCTICRLEEAKVSHFGVPICTGCRAFFRRSVGQQKTYRCLNSRLCGNHKPVPSRRVCKFCRFQRCVAAGMLKSKEQFQMQLQGIGNCNWGNNAAIQQWRQQQFVGNEEPSTSNPDALMLKNRHQLLDATSILEQFMLCRRKIAYERMQNFYTANPSGGHSAYTMHDSIKLGWKEAGLFNRALLGAMPSFIELQKSDRDVLFLEYSYCWSVLERIWSTIRNNGHQTRRLHDFDGQFWQLNERGTQQYFGAALADILKDPHPAIHQAIQGFFFAGAIAILDATKEVAKSGLDEEEASTLCLLMFTRQEVLGMVSGESAKMLRTIRHRTLRSLGQHVQSQGREVAERIAQIVSLIGPIQGVVLICKRSATLMRSACTERSLPGGFLKLMDKVEVEMGQLKLCAT